MNARVPPPADVRIIPCETCQSEGRILRSNGGPDDIDCGPCPNPNCEAGGEIIEVQPIVYIDLDLWDTNKQSRSGDYSRSAWEARNVLR